MSKKTSKKTEQSKKEQPKKTLREHAVGACERALATLIRAQSRLAATCGASDILEEAVSASERAREAVEHLETGGFVPRPRAARAKKPPIAVGSKVFVRTPHTDRYPLYSMDELVGLEVVSILDGKARCKAMNGNELPFTLSHLRTE